MDLLYAWCSAGLGALHALTHFMIITTLLLREHDHPYFMEEEVAKTHIAISNGT
mgnify:CR=1 FL=1